jgi:hypothetical protein
MLRNVITRETTDTSLMLVQVEIELDISGTMTAISDCHIIALNSTTKYPGPHSGASPPTHSGQSHRSMAPVAASSKLRVKPERALDHHGRQGSEGPSGARTAGSGGLIEGWEHIRSFTRRSRCGGRIHLRQPANEARGHRGRASPSGRAGDRRRHASSNVVLAGRALLVPYRGPRWGRNSAEPGEQQRTAGDNEPRGQRPFQSEVLGRESPGPRFHTAEPTGFCQSYTIITMPLDLPGVLCR